MKRILALPLAFCMAATAWAHNGMEHVMGVVAAITSTSLDVKGANGKLITVMTDSKTMWMKGKEMATAKDIHTGDRVVIHAKKVDGKMVAAEVELGESKPAAHTH